MLAVCPQRIVRDPRPYTDYVNDAEALAYMHERALASQTITQLAEHRNNKFPGCGRLEAASRPARHHGAQAPAPTKAGVNPDPVGIATEGALWGSVKADGFVSNPVIVSDDAESSSIACSTTSANARCGTR
jgi:hypothetical protein